MLICIFRWASLPIDRFVSSRLCRACCDCCDLQHHTTKIWQSTLETHCRLIWEKHSLCLSWKLYLVHFIVDFLPDVGTSSFFYMCFILFWMETGRSQKITIFISLTDMFSSDGFYLAHVYYIIHNRIPIMKWMNATIHSEQMCIKWQSRNHCLLYVKEINTKLAVSWHSYISQFERDRYTSVTTIPY